MIYNKWYIVMESKEVKRGGLAGAVRFNERLLFWRKNSGELVCFYDKCAHRGASLSIGKHFGDEVACPFHGFRYDSNGKTTLIPANGRASAVPDNFKMKTYPVIEKFGFIFMWGGEVREEYPEIKYFENIDDSFSFCTTKHIWNVQYSRAIENQLDLVHLPFVHKTTIGAGNKTLVNGPVELVKEGEIEFRVFNEIDKGQKAKNEKELQGVEEEKQHIHFIFPNMWQNWIVQKMRILVAFVPVDEEHTCIYLRTAQKFVKFPILKELTDAIMMYFSIIVLNQDKRVVLTQIPKYSELKMNENLVSGDKPIATYRMLRDRMKNTKKQ